MDRFEKNYSKVIPLKQKEKATQRARHGIAKKMKHIE